MHLSFPIINYTPKLNPHQKNRPDKLIMSPVGLPPGFRFHPTDEELVNYYLKRKINGQEIELDIIPEVDLYKCEPWELSEKSFLPSKDPEWYFFGPRDRKYPNGFRTNRATRAGYWKSTGKDRRVVSQTRVIGMKKTLVYYRGRAPQGLRTDWVMHEYRVDDKDCEDTSGLQDSYALCRVFKKNGICTETAEQEIQQSFVYGGATSSSAARRNRTSPAAIMETSPDAAMNHDINHLMIDQYNNYDSTMSPDVPVNASSSSCLEDEEKDVDDNSWMQFITDDDPWSSSSMVNGGDDVTYQQQQPQVHHNHHQQHHRQVSANTSTFTD